MPSQILDRQYGNAILQSVQNGSYPDPEDLISSELPPSTLPGVVDLLDSARKVFEVIIRPFWQKALNILLIMKQDDIRSVSKVVAPDVDGWIVQAQRLQRDIQECQAISRSITSQAQDGGPLQDQAQDAASKVALLQEEVSFNKSLVASLEAIRTFQEQLRVISSSLKCNAYSKVGKEFLEAERQLSVLERTSQARVSSVLRTQLYEIGQDAKEATRKAWIALFKVNIQEQLVEIDSKDEISEIALCLRRLGLFESYMNKFCKDFISAILLPRMHVGRNDIHKNIQINDTVVRLQKTSTDQGISGLITDLLAVIKYLNLNLPKDAASHASEHLMPKILSVLTDGWLANAIPNKLDDMDTFKVVLDLVQEFARNVDNHGWPGKDKLIQWTRDSPQAWLSRRKERALLDLRKAMSQGFGELSVVSREETRLVSSDDAVFATQNGDDWNAEWSEDDESTQPARDISSAQTAEGAHDDQDVSAWGLGEDEEIEVSAKKETTTESNVSEDDSDAWGWGDDQEEEKLVPPSTSAKQRKKDGDPAPQANGQREVTLQEKFNVTQLPGEIIKILEDVLSDAQSLSEPK